MDVREAAREVPMFCARLGVWLILMSVAAAAQSYVISTVAGGVPPPTPVAAVHASIGGPEGVATGPDGSVYFVSIHCVFKVDAGGVLTRVAGTGRPGYSGDGGQAVNAQLYGPGDVEVDGSGNVYVADSYNNRIRRITPGGVITTVAGRGAGSFGGDGGPAKDATLYMPLGVAVDRLGNVFIADTYNNRVRKVGIDGIITTAAGKGTGGYSGDGGPTTSAELRSPRGVATDETGNLYIADSNNSRIRKVSPSGVITTFAGNGTSGFEGDGGPASSAKLSYPTGIAVDASGNVYIVDSSNFRIRKVSPGGVITTVAGNGMNLFAGDGGQATSAGVAWPFGVAVDKSGSFYIAEAFSSRVRKVAPSGIITTAAGSGYAGSSGNDGPARDAQLYDPQGLALDGWGNLYIAEASNHRVRKVTAEGIITTVAGTGVRGYSNDGGPASRAPLNMPYSVAVDAAGNLFIADTYTNRIRKVLPNGIITTVAGTGASGFSGDGGPATSAKLSSPHSLAIDGTGNLFFSDEMNHRVRKVSTNGIITTVAGTGTLGYSGDGGPATSANLNHPQGITLDSAGNLYIADEYNGRIRQVTPDGVILTLAGGNVGVYPGDGGPASSVILSRPRGVMVTASGDVLIAEEGGHRIRRVDTSGIITTVAGTGTGGYSGDNGPANKAELAAPTALVTDGSGNLYVADADANAVRVLRPAGGGGALAITAPSPLPQGTVGATYSHALSAAGGTAPYTWSLTTGALPGGLTLSSGGTISGKPSAAGTYGFTVQVKDGAAATAVKEFSLTIVNQVASAPVIFTGGVVNAASNAAGQPIAAGMLVSIYGSGLAASIVQADSFPLPTSLGDVGVTINGVRAPLIYVAPGQINAQVPWDVLPSGTRTGNVPVVVTRGGVASAPVDVSVGPFSPGVFAVNSGVGNAIAINADGSLAAGAGSISGIATNPAKAGDPKGLIILATGLGALDSYPANGDNSRDRLRRNLTTPEVLVGGVPAQVVFSGASPEFAGVNQINITVPDRAPLGDKVPLQLRVGGITTTDRVTIAVSRIAEPVVLTPAAGLSVAGQMGQLGSASQTITYTLQNNLASAVAYTLASSASWVTLSKTSGTLAANGRDTFLVSVNANANMLPAGSHSATVTLTERTYGTSLTRTVSLALTTGPCLNIAGQWMASERGSLTCTVTVNGESLTETDPISGSDLITISQQGCRVSYTSSSMMSAFGAGRTLRQGEIQGVTVRFSGIMGELAAGFTYEKNQFEATGPVGYRTINLTGSGALAGRGVWEGMNTIISCTASSTATFTKWP